MPLGQTRFGSITLKQKNGTRVLHIPVTIVRGQEKIQLTKTCTPTDLANGETTQCTITATNPTFDDVNFLIEDRVPKQLVLDKSSVVNGRVKDGNLVQQFGTIPGSDPANVTIAPGDSPAGGYLPLSAFGITPIAGTDDDTVTNFTVPPFTFAGETWTSLGVSSNGYLIVGGGNGSADNQFQNQNLPESDEAEQRPGRILDGHEPGRNLRWRHPDRGAHGRHGRLDRR